MLSTPLATSGFTSTGWYPLTTQGYSFTFWAYTTAGWTGSGFTWISGSNDWYITVNPGGRVSFGQSNYNGYPATAPADGSWGFYALIFPINSVTLNNKPILWQNDVSYTITPQVGGTGSLAPFGKYNTPFYLGSNANAAYMGQGTYTGYLDDFRMYNIALTNNQVANVYLEGMLMIRFPLNSNVNPTINMGNTNTSNTLTLGTTSTMISTTNPFGVTSYCLQYVTSSIGSSMGGFTLPTKYSVSLWWRNTNFNFVNGTSTAGPVAWYINWSGTTTTTGYAIELYNKGFLIATGNTSSGIGYSNYSFTGTPAGSQTSSESGLSLNDNVWHHVVQVYNGTQLLTYVDNVYWGNFGNYPITTVTNMFLGNPNLNGVNTSSTIHFYDFRVYKTALSVQQVSDLYNNVI